MRWVSVVIVGVMIAASCTPSDGPESIPLPTSPDTTTSTTSTTSTTTTTTTTTTVVPPKFQATVRRTTDGVPHVLADDRESLMFGQGWVSAADSGCVLIDQILKIRGERAVNLGPGENGESVESDFAWRAIGILNRATKDFDEASDQVVETFESFARGWNEYLRQAGTDGLTGWCAGAEWVRPVQPVEVYAYARSVALQSSSGRLADYLAAAQPPSDEAATGDLTPGTTSTATGELPTTGDNGSNAWAVGARRVAGGEGAMLVANPHLPWEGELRLGEIHLTVPDEIDIYGAQLVGLPGVWIGFTDDVGWSHTESAGHRFTAYQLTLDPESPTTYVVDGERQEMKSREHSVEILRPDGSVDTETRELWRTRYGPVIDLPDVGWTATTATSYRDANITNDEFVEQAIDLLDVQDLDDLIATHRRHQGSANSNTVAAGRDGRVWYADTAAAPKLSKPAEQQFVQRRLDNPVTRAAWQEGIMLLDGSDSINVWATDPDSRDPGLVPWADQPMVQRQDYVFNANDSYWVPSAEFTLDGDYSVVHGESEIAQSMRSRQNAAVLANRNALGLAGKDHKFSGPELRDAAFDNVSHHALLLKDHLVESCTGLKELPTAAVLDAEGNELVPDAEIDLRPACRVLQQWDGRYDLEQPGPLLWRETMAHFDDDVFSSAGLLFSDDFNPNQATRTPRVPNPNVLPLLAALGRAVQVIEASGFAVDSTLGAAQFTERSGERVAIHGGTHADGVTNVVAWSDDVGSSTEPHPVHADPIVPDSDLSGSGYPVNSGTSFVMTVDFTSNSPSAWAILTYGQTIDRESESFDQQMLRFSDKNWREIAFTEAAILADPNFDERVVSGD